MVGFGTSFCYKEDIVSVRHAGPTPFPYVQQAWNLKGFIPFSTHHTNPHSLTSPTELKTQADITTSHLTTHVHMATANTRTCTEMKRLPVLDESIRSSLNKSVQKNGYVPITLYLNHVITHAHYQQWAVLTKFHTRILVANDDL